MIRHFAATVHYTLVPISAAIRYQHARTSVPFEKNVDNIRQAPRKSRSTIRSRSMPATRYGTSSKTNIGRRSISSMRKAHSTSSSGRANTNSLKMTIAQLLAEAGNRGCRP
jgi:hypothetical protein